MTIGTDPVGTTPIGVSGEETVPTSLTWETISDWDAAQSEWGVHHEQPANTDWAPDDEIEKGYATYDWESGGNLFGYWTFDEAAGGSIAYDQSGNNLDGSIDAGVSLGTTGLMGTTCYTFDGSSTVQVSSDPLLNVSDLTVSVWFKTGSTGGDPIRTIVTRMDGSSPSNRQFWIVIDNGQGFSGGVAGSVAARAGDGSAADVVDLVSSADYRDGNWHHVAFRIDSVAGTASLWVDGTQEDSTSTIGSAPDTGTYPLYWSYDPADGARYWLDEIDETVLFGEAKSDQFINDLYNTPL